MFNHMLRLTEDEVAHSEHMREPHTKPLPWLRAPMVSRSWPQMQLLHSRSLLYSTLWMDTFLWHACHGPWLQFCSSGSSTFKLLEEDRLWRMRHGPLLRKRWHSGMHTMGIGVHTPPCCIAHAVASGSSIPSTWLLREDQWCSPKGGEASRAYVAEVEGLDHSEQKTDRRTDRQTDRQSDRQTDCTRERHAINDCTEPS